MKRLILIISFLLPTLMSFGQTWENVGSGLSDGVTDLQKFQNKLYAGGRFGARYWNDTNWKNLPNPIGIDFPLTLAVYNDTLYTGGDFNSWGSTSDVYKFDGINWIQVGGDFDEASSWSSTEQLLSFNGGLISGGNYNTINGTSIYNIASWNGTKWDSLGSGLNGTVWNLAEYKGKLIAAGDFTASGSDTTIRHIAKWDGTTWSPLDTTFSFYYSVFQTTEITPMISFDSLLIIGNVWDTIKGTPMKGVTAWNGTTFTSMGNNLINTARNFWVFNNELYMCADLNTLNPNAFEYVVLKWTGFFWQQVGGDFNHSVVTIDDFNNQLFCGGVYTTPTSYVAKLNTTAGISTIDGKQIFEFYPNPATDHVTFTTSEQGKLTIINQLGQVVNVVSIKDNQTEISTDNLSAGVYLLTFQTEKNSITRKLIIQK